MKPIHSLSDEDLGRRLHQAIQALPDAPAGLQRAAVGLWAQRAEASPSVLGALVGAALREVKAALTFDSWSAPGMAVSVRSLRSATRHLLYSAEGRDIDLRIASGAESFSMAGQILGPDESGRVELTRIQVGPEGQRVAELDNMGEFRIEGLGVGTYLLTLRMGEDQIVLPPIEVGPQTGEPQR